MIAGMIPMTLGIGEDRVATRSTLFVLPSLYAVLQVRAHSASPALDPDDSASRYYDHA
jgi:hypothetical protein